MEEMAQTLSGLSKDQMTEVLRRLDSASKAPEGKGDPDVSAAYEKHREILEALRVMLARYDAVENLDQAADRLEKLSKVANGTLLARQPIRPRSDAARRPASVVDRAFHDRTPHSREPKISTACGSSISRKIFRSDARSLIKQVLDLKSKLADDHKLRIEKMNKYVANASVEAKLAQFGE